MTTLTEPGPSGPTLDAAGDVYILDLGDGKNLWNPEWMAAVNGLLDEVARAPDPRALVTTARGRYWSLGLDTGWFAAHPDRFPELGSAFLGLLDRMLTFPAGTVAAIQGHAFGAGALLALAHDFRLMAGSQARFCLPEVDLGFSFTDGTVGLIQAKLGPAAASRAMLTGHRWDAREALTAGIVDATPPEGVLADALALARTLAPKNSAPIGEIKSRMYRDVHRELSADARRIGTGAPIVSS